MPEYSTPKLTPSESVKIPSMDGSSAGYMLTGEMLDIIRNTYGQANGLATLGADGKLPSAQLPDLADDVLVYGSYALLPNPGIEGKLYITADTNEMYRWDGTQYVVLSVDLSAYATKAEMEAADSDLKNALQATNARVENLEQEHGSYQEVTAKSPYTIPSGKAKNWAVNVLRGVTRAKNQLIPDNKITYTFTVSQNITQDQWGSNFLPLAYLVPYVGHTVLAFRKPHSDKFYVAFGNTADAFTSGKAYGNQGDPLSGVYTLTNTLVGSSGQLYIRYLAGLQAGTYTSEIYLVDLTQYFGTTDLSFLGSTDGEKLATIQQNYPELLVPSNYGNSLLSTRYEGVRSEGVNLWNEKWIVGGLNNNTGLPDASRTNRVSSEDFIPISQYKLYYYLNTADTAWLYFYDKDNNYIGRYDSKSASFTPLVGSAFMKFETWNGYGNVYKNDVQISEVINNTTTSVNTTYHPYTESTLSLPTPITLRSAGTVAETFDLETGEKTNLFGSHTFTADDTWGYAGGVFNFNLPTMKKGGAIISDAPYTKQQVVYTSLSDKCMASSTTEYSAVNPYFLIRDDSLSGSTSAIASAMVGKTIYFELATPDAPTQLDPIQNPYLPTESGGTISSILTDAVDDSMTLGYINL